MTLLIQTSKFHFPYLAPISQVPFKFSLLHKNLFWFPLLFQYNWIYTFLMQKAVLDELFPASSTPAPDICRHREPAISSFLSPSTLHPPPSAPSYGGPHLAQFLSLFLWWGCSGLPLAWCEQSWMSAGTLSWVFLFTTPMCTVSLDKDLRLGSLVLTPVSFRNCSLSQEFVFQSKLWPLTQFLTIPFYSIAYTGSYDSLSSTCWPVSALIRNPATVSWPLILGPSETDPQIMFFGHDDGASCQLSRFILASPIPRSLLEGPSMGIWEPCHYKDYFHTPYFSNYKSLKHKSYVSFIFPFLKKHIVCIE